MIRNIGRYIILCFIATAFACSEVQQEDTTATCGEDYTESMYQDGKLAVRGALLSTRFESFEALQSVVEIKYFNLFTNSQQPHFGNPFVRIRHCSNGQQVSSVLTYGTSEKDFVAARDGRFWERIALLIQSPYAVMSREELICISVLARRKPDVFGAGDPAFYDISKAMMEHIVEDQLAELDSMDLHSDKGYFNTVNHITAQVFMTALFTERLADFVADAHERRNLITLITGRFSEAKRLDLVNGPVDNYVDMINNEWGQELGKRLREKHGISQYTHWTPTLLTNFLNDIQAYYRWAFQIGFEPFRPDDEIVLKFTRKLNIVMRKVATY